MGLGRPGLSPRGGRWIVSAIPIEIKFQRRRSIPRFLARNAKWVAEARDTLPLWREWASEELEPEQRGKAAARKSADAREEEWSSAYSVR
jgi:hypothetical protein